MNGPCCDQEDIKSTDEVLTGLGNLYMACRDCPSDPDLDKNAPFSHLDAQNQVQHQRCSSCGRAPLDLVMLEVLEVLVDQGLRGRSDSLRSVGWPLVEIGYPLPYPPRLGENELIIAGEKLDEAAAERMLKIPEIKGVILSGGVPGFSDPEKSPCRWKLLAGSDLRADVVQSLLGELLVYKSQSQVHVEFPRENAPKMRILEGLYFQGKIKNVADCLCGPGTLGLMCAASGAKRVVLNDIWLPAVKNVMLNLDVNRALLGIDTIEQFEFPNEDVGSEPKLVGLAEGECRIEVYHGDAKNLFTRAEPAELCLVDPFPGMNTDDLVEACRACGEIVVV